MNELYTELDTPINLLSLKKVGCFELDGLEL